MKYFNAGSSNNFSPINSPLAGDVILIESRGSKGKGNSLAQRMLRPRSFINKFVPTHVAIATTRGGVFFHATVGEGTTFTSVNYLIDNEKYKPNYKVYRNISLESIFQNEEKESQFYNLSRLYLNAEYEVISNYLKEDEKKLFCSMLVCKYFELIGIKVAVNVPSHRTLPIDIEHNLSKNPKWKDVTMLYRQLFDIGVGDAQFIPAKNVARSASESLANSYNMIETSNLFLERMHESNVKLFELVKKLAEQNEEKFKTIFSNDIMLEINKNINTSN